MEIPHILYHYSACRNISQRLYNSENADGLAVDWINDNLYILFGDEQQHSELPVHVAIYDITTGGDYRTILTSTRAAQSLLLFSCGSICRASAII